jgi:hypothetical protein
MTSTIPHIDLIAICAYSDIGPSFIASSLSIAPTAIKTISNPSASNPKSIATDETTINAIAGPWTIALAFRSS